jgi:hypothetical protein
MPTGTQHTSSSHTLAAVKLRLPFRFCRPCRSSLVRPNRRNLYNEYRKYVIWPKNEVYVDV